MMDKKIIVSITFDDGNEEDFTIFWPMLKKYNLRGTFYVITDQIGLKGKLTFEQLNILYKNGNEIGSHTHTHPRLTRLDDKRVEFELRKSKEVLAEFNPRTLAYPDGDYDNRVIKFVKKYYQAARGFNPPYPDIPQSYGINENLDSRYSLKVLNIEDILNLIDIRAVNPWVITVIHSGMYPKVNIDMVKWYIKRKGLQASYLKSLILYLKYLIRGHQEQKAKNRIYECFFRYISECPKFKVLTVSEALDYFQGDK